MSPPSAKKPRPLSPHLQIYKPQLTSGLSIFHRITGVGLSFGLVLFVLWLTAIAQGADSYAMFMGCAHSIVGQLVLFGMTWAFFFHLCTGIRHLFWDAGKYLEIEQVNRSGVFIIVLSVAMTLALWLKMMWCHP